MLFVRVNSSHITVTHSVDGVFISEKSYRMNNHDFQRFLVKFSDEEIVVYGRHAQTHLNKSIWPEYYPKRQTLGVLDDREVLMHSESQ